MKINWRFLLKLK